MTKSRTIRWILLIVAVGAAGIFTAGSDFTATNRRQRPATRRRRRRGVPFRVTIAPVEKADFPVYLTGLGTVQGFNTVVVRTRVDGQIDKIAFKEGQFVNQGDLLVEIDPRPYQATLDQAKAKKEQDEANLANANLDLQRYTKLGEFATKQQTRYPALHRSAVDGADRGRRRGDLQRPDPARLHPGQVADLRASPACARSISATSSTPRPRPGS